MTNGSALQEDIDSLLVLRELFYKTNCSAIRNVLGATCERSMNRSNCRQLDQGQQLGLHTIRCQPNKHAGSDDDNNLNNFGRSF